LKSGLLQRLGNPKDEKLRNQLYVFMVCLGISIFIWFLIVLSKKNMETIDFPIIYGKAPSNLTLTNTPDSLISIRLSSTGFEFINLKYLTRKKPIAIDLDDLNVQKEGSKHVAKLSTSEIEKRLIKEYRLSKELISVSPQVLHFEFASVISKKVPIKPNLHLGFEKQFQLSDSLILKLDSVFVIGANESIESIDVVHSEFIEITGINKSQEIIVGLVNPGNIEDVRISESETTVSLKVEKFTESTIELPITVNNKVGLEVKTFPEKIQLTYLVALDDYKRINTEMFLIGIDTTDNLRKVNKLKVKIIQYPSFIKITKIEPLEVEFLVLER